MSAKENFLKGVEIYSEGDEAVRVSFDKAVGSMYVCFGDVYNSFVNVSGIPPSEEVVIPFDPKMSRDDYCGKIFEALFYTSLEAYVMAMAVTKTEPVDSITRFRFGSYIHRYLFKKFSSHVRRNDIKIICDETNNPYEIVSEDKIRIAVCYRPSFGNKSFYPISIVRA